MRSVKTLVIVNEVTEPAVMLRRILQCGSNQEKIIIAEL